MKSLVSCALVMISMTAISAAAYGACDGVVVSVGVKKYCYGSRWEQRFQIDENRALAVAIDAAEMSGGARVARTSNGHPIVETDFRNPGFDQLDAWVTLANGKKCYCPVAYIFVAFNRKHFYSHDVSCE